MQQTSANQHLQAIADQLGRWSRGGASAERMYRTLTDPGYHKASCACLHFCTFFQLLQPGCQCLVLAPGKTCAVQALCPLRTLKLLLADFLFLTLLPRMVQATNKHGRRLNPRRRIPMHVMACHALRALPGNEGNLSQIAAVIKAHPEFAKELDWSPRPGTKTYPRWVCTTVHSCASVLSVPVVMSD